MKTVLFVVTSHGALGTTGRVTGVWLEEFTVPYYYLTDRGVKVVTASPCGGEVPVDPLSETHPVHPESVRRYRCGGGRSLTRTARLADVDPVNFDAIFYCGGHGPLWDLAIDRTNAKMLSGFFNCNKLVAALCHGPAALLKARRRDGERVLRGRRMTAFSNREEEEVKLDKAVPFLLEDELVSAGADYRCHRPGSSHVVIDGNLITGQNPQSALALTAAFFEHLNRCAELRHR